jgi:hypothetical protein
MLGDILLYLTTDLNEQSLWEELERVLPIFALTFIFFSLVYIVDDYYDPVERQKRLEARRTKKMEERERAFLRRKVADTLTDVLENAALEGKVSWKSIQETWSWVGNRLEINDLLPKRQLREMLKHQIKQRLNAGVHNKRIPFPDLKYPQS